VDRVTRPFRFSTVMYQSMPARQMADEARRAESMGYVGLVFADHLLRLSAPLPMIAVVAAATERLRVGPFVLNNDFRHPAILAQDLATLDVISEGRLDIGIGAGFNRPEYDAAGISLDPIGTRVSRLEESITVLKGLFDDTPFSFAGEHYTIRQMDGYPKPVQRPHPRFLIGAGGRRLLTLAGREADAISLATRFLPNGHADPRSITIAATEEKVEWVRRSAGDRFGQIELNIHPQISPTIITDRARPAVAALADRLRQNTGFELTEKELLDSPHIFIGSIDAIVEKIRALRARFGISSIMLGKIDDLAPVVERLAGT
jgi:probable F420-dependent oxidoreductase